MTELYEVRYKKIVVESIEVIAASPEDAMERVDKGEFSSKNAKIWNKYPLIEAFLVEDHGRTVLKKETKTIVKRSDM